MKTETGYHILLDLDAVLDTRLGTIALFDEDTALSLSKDPRYVNRFYDEFSDIITHPEWSDADFKETYEKRNDLTLAVSRPTPMLYTLNPFLLGLVADCTHNPDKSQVEVCINMYPYLLDEEAKLDIIAAIRIHVPEPVTVTATYMPPDTINASYIRKNLTHWVTYDIDAWVGYHFSSDLTEDKLAALRTPRFTIIGPKRFKGKKEFLEFTTYIKTVTSKNAIKDPFVEQAFLMIDHVALDFRSMCEFSILSAAAMPDGEYVMEDAAQNNSQSG